MVRHKQWLVAAAIVIATLSGQSTALAANSAGVHRSVRPSSGKKESAKPGPSTTTTTTSTIPEKAESLLKQLLAVAGQVTSDNERAAALSETYDQERVRLADALTRVHRLDAEVRSAQAAVSKAALRLRQAAIRAYVTGEAATIDTPLLTDGAADGAMVTVYASFATGQLQSAETRYESVLGAVDSSRAEATATEHGIAQGLAFVAAVRSQAERLIQQAANEYSQVSRQLLAIVGPKEFATLFSPWPAGALYKGPDLGGTDVGTVANALQGLAAVAEAEKFLGVPYVWGGAGKSGVDCSGLTMLAWQAAGISLPHSATLQWEESEPVPLGKLQPGDLLFYHFADDGNTPVTHVVMYVGSGPYGTATVIQASQPGTVVAYSPIYFEGLVGAGRP